MGKKFPGKASSEEEAIAGASLLAATFHEVPGQAPSQAAAPAAAPPAAPPAAADPALRSMVLRAYEALEHLTKALCRLECTDPEAAARTVSLDGKTGPRTVPLSADAVRELALVRPQGVGPETPVLSCTRSTFNSAFGPHVLRKACADAGVLLVSDEIWADWTLPHEGSGRRSWSAQACRASPVAAPDGPVRMAARAQSTRTSLIAGRLGSSGAAWWPVELGSRPR